MLDGLRETFLIYEPRRENVAGASSENYTSGAEEDDEGSTK